MATNILAVGDTAANAELTLAAGDVATIGLKVAGGGSPSSEAYVTISLKDDGNNWLPLGRITAVDPAKVIQAPGTYQFARPTGVAVGVFRG